jgi:hypothetical protein
LRWWQDAEDSNRADYVLPEREELERITPKIEEELESLLDEEEKVCTEQGVRAGVL